MFSPGETIRHQFTIPFAAAEIAKILVTYKQKDRIVVERTVEGDALPQEEAESTTFNLDFTQKESLAFKDNQECSFQINVYTKHGSRCTSKTYPVKVYTQYYKAII